MSGINDQFLKDMKISRETEAMQIQYIVVTKTK